GTVAATDNILQAIQKVDGNIALKAPLASPTFTGAPTAPTQNQGDNSTKIATTAYVDAAAAAGVVDATDAVKGKIQLAGELGGTAASPTITNAAVIGKVLTGFSAGAGTVAATDNILQAIQKVDGNIALKAPLASPTFTGTPSLPTGTTGITQAAADNSTKLATTAYADAAAGSAVTGKQNTLTNSAGLAGALDDETGTGLAVFATSPTLVTPNLGTPSTLVGTNITGTAAGLTAGTVTTNANLTGVVTSTGNATSIANGAITNAMLANAAVANLSGTNTGDQDLSALAPLASPALTGTPTAPTQTAADNSTKIATTAYADAAAGAAVTGKQNTLTNSAGLAGALDDETGTGLAVFATSPTLVTPNLGTPSTLVGTNITGTAAGLTAGTVTTNANLTGEVTSTGNATTVTNAAVIGKVLTGFSSGAGTVAATDNILEAIQKVDGNIALKAPLASPTFTGTPSLPTGTTGITQAAADNSTKLATTAYADAAAGAAVTGKQNTLTNSAGL
ncbi:hypothetical protein, partial [Bosea sp. (in: a-proteobacteria)]|uniref:hypothetical protein n=1 Tax=Bosea sp. (in: a-proteobacteria) TaxID=1871050 RepID=UPI0027327FB4